MFISRKIIIPAVLFLFPMIGMAEDVTEEWVVRFNGESARSREQGSLMAVDSNGNVYITGHSLSIFSADYGNLVTIKYDSSGNLLWSKRYRKDIYSGEQAHDIKVDSDGNIYVAGFSTTQVSPVRKHSALLIKYSSTGELLWEKVTNISGHDREEINSIALDSEGNIYTAAKNKSEERSSYLISKYTADGENKWNRAYEIHDSSWNPGSSIPSLAVDNLDNIYLTGMDYSSDTKHDFLTIKFEPLSGQEQWLRKYNNDDNGNDIPRALAIDENNNIYVAGTSTHTETGIGAHYLTIKYNSFGNQQWVNHEPDTFGTIRDVSVTNNHIYVIGDKHDTIKYAVNDGARIWKRRKTSLPSSEPVPLRGGKIVVNDLDEVFTLSLSYFVATKYDANGNEKWSTQYEGESDQVDYGRDIAIDNADNLYSTGVSAPLENTETDFVTIKYSMTFDIDEDGIDDTLDNCPSIANPSQLNTDGDAQGNACDLDDDNDGVSDAPDNCPVIANSDQLNTDDDAQGNACDPDDDNDGVDDTLDNCPSVYNSDQLDTDGSGQGNACDPDDDGDGIDDALDSCPIEDSTGLDADHDGCIDSVSGLVHTLDTLVSEGTIAEEMSNSLRQKINRAIASAGRDNLCTAINQLESFKNQIEAQRGKKISDETADLLISYSNNLISGFEADLGAGESCS